MAPVIQYVFVTISRTYERMTVLEMDPTEIAKYN
jgi:hypothetical protein